MSIIFNYLMKKITKNSAQKWLQGIQKADEESFNQIYSALFAFDQTQNSFQCYNSMRKVLIKNSSFQDSINQFLKEGNKFQDAKVLNKKIQELMKHINKKSPQVYQSIMKKIMEMKNKAGINNDQNIGKFILEHVRGYQELQSEVREIIDNYESGRMNSNHMKHLEQKQNFRVNADIDYYEEEEEEQFLVGNEFYEKLTKVIYLHEGSSKQLNRKIEKQIFHLISQILNQEEHTLFLKLLKLYSLSIISTGEFLQQIKPYIPQIAFPTFKKIIQYRSSAVQQNSQFRPLNEKDFSKFNRVTPCYVQTPRSYPTYCSTKTEEMKQILNIKYVNIQFDKKQVFDISQKNVHENKLNQNQDSMYDLNVFKKKMKMSLKFLYTLIEKLQENRGYNPQKEIERVFSLGCLAIIYHYAKGEILRQLEFYLLNHPLQTCKVFAERIQNILDIVEETCKVPGQFEKAIEQHLVASLDKKFSVFEDIEKSKFKNKNFIDELESRYKLLQSGRRLKDSFFQIFDSISPIAQNQGIRHRKIRIYNIEQQENPSFLPIFTLSFEDYNALQTLYSMILNMVHQSSKYFDEPEQKGKCFELLKKIIKKLFRKIPNIRYYNKQNDYQYFINMLKQSKYNFDYKLWIEEQAQFQEYHREENPSRMPQYKEIHDLKFKPEESEDLQIVYGIDNLYIFWRYFYVAYERILKMKELQKDKEYEILYYLHLEILSQQQFREGIRNIFKQKSFLFLTMHKLVDNILKSVKSLLYCEVTEFSLANMKIQELNYLNVLLTHKFKKVNQKSRFVRIASNLAERLIYINLLNIKQQKFRVTKTKKEEDEDFVLEKKGKVSKRDKEIVTREKSSKIQKVDEGFKGHSSLNEEEMLKSLGHAFKFYNKFN